MQFILASSWQDSTNDITDRLVRELENNNVLWLVSGGSNIQASIKIAQQIPTDQTKKLTVMLVDERYGDVGHADSNWAQLMSSGFAVGDATLIPTLSENLSFIETVNSTELKIEKAFSENKVIIGQLGIGDDGHIAGILPNSLSAEQQKVFVYGYESTPFKRITLTFPAIRKLTVAYVFAFGEKKNQALSNLRDKNTTLAEQPSQILKELPESYVYNDQLGPRNG